MRWAKGAENSQFESNPSNLEVLEKSSCGTPLKHIKLCCDLYSSVLCELISNLTYYFQT